jgi:hypothetical protein
MVVVFAHDNYVLAKTSYRKKTPMKIKSLVALLSLAVLAITLSVTTFAQKRVRGYTKKDGTVVQPHRRTSPNKTENDNWSSKGNTNPDTGKKGTKTPRR